MKNKTIKGMWLVLIIVLIYFIVGFADLNLIGIKAFIEKSLTIKFNGEVLELTDEQGLKLYPISVEGLTYVPVRAISESLGLTVDWDDNKKTISLNSAPQGALSISEQLNGDWDFAEVLKPNKAFIKNSPSVEFVKSVYSSLNPANAILKFEYVRSEDGEISKNTNYFIMPQTILADLVYKIDDSLLFALDKDRDLNAMYKIQRITVNELTLSYSLYSRSESANLNFVPVTPNGIISATLTDVWGKEIKSK